MLFGLKKNNLGCLHEPVRLRLTNKCSLALAALVFSKDYERLADEVFTFSCLFPLGEDILCGWSPAHTAWVF